MLEIKRALGPDNWLSNGDFVARREAIQDLFLNHPVRPEETDEEWPEDRQLYSEMVVVKNDELVGTAMLVVDPEREDRPARIFGMGFTPEHRTEFAIRTLEETLIQESYLDGAYPFVEATDGKLVPNPHAQFAELLDDPDPVIA